MSKIGYIIVSTEHQETARQQEIMCDYQVDRIFSEKLSGANGDRPQLRAMLEYVREGDTLYIESISRLGCSTKGLLNIIDTLTAKGVTLISHKEKIDIDTPAGNFMLTVFAALSQLEREQLKQRQREDIEIDKAQGKYTGRKPIEIDWTRFGQLYGEWKSKSITGRDFMRRMGLSANTFYRRVREYEADTALPSLPLLESHLRRTETPLRAVRACGALKPSEKKRPEKCLCEQISGLCELFSSKRVCCHCGTRHNDDMACAERFAGVPIDYGQVAHINIVP